MDTPRTFTAWELIGFDGRLNDVSGLDDEALDTNVYSVRVKGGRTLYDAVLNGSREGVRLARVDIASNGLRQVNRYIDPFLTLELIPR